MHIIADFWGMSHLPDSSSEIESLLIEAAKTAKANILKTALYKFDPQGVTGVILLSESHISIHTWPETGYASIDAYTCGDHTDPMAAVNYLKKSLKPLVVQMTKIKRGQL